MNDIQIFNNPEFGEIRTVIIDGEPWFVGSDIGKALGYADPRSGIRKNVDTDDRKGCPVGTPSRGMQEMTVINESGLYSLIFGSKLESAKKFKKWVTSEVLPQLRKTGSYGIPQLPQNPMELLKLHYDALVEVNGKVDDLSGRITNVQKDFESFKHDLPILGIEESLITSAVAKKGVSLLGGKNSSAYQNKSLRTKLYSDIHRQLRREFGVTSYKAIKRSQSDYAIQIINDYRPPLVLTDEIVWENSQERLCV